MTNPAPRRYRWARWIAAGLFILVCGFLLASAIGARVVVAGSRAPLSESAQQIGNRHISVSFPSRVDSLQLSGWLFRSDRPTGRSLILVHGWQGNRADVDFVPVARYMLARGYDVLMFDLRASGTSHGSAQTLANLETRDLLGAYDFMVGRGYAPSEMAILGNSMGAATVIEAAPDLQQVAALISDSAFANLGSAMEDALTHFTGLPGALARPAMMFARAYGVRPDLSPESVVRSLPQRAFLFIHARGDGLIGVGNAEELGAASANPGTAVLILDGKEHLDTYTHDSNRYLQAVTGFIDSQVQATKMQKG